MSKKLADGKIQLNDREFNAALLVGSFNTQYSKSIVYLRLTDSTSNSFQIHFRFTDEFVESSIYDRGNAVIYPSEAVYTAIQELAWTIEPHSKIIWNNTQTIGWFSH